MASVFRCKHCNNVVDKNVIHHCPSLDQSFDPSDGLDFLISVAVGAATDSTIIGAVVGGDILGAALGDALSDLF